MVPEGSETSSHEAILAIAGTYGLSRGELERLIELFRLRVDAYERGKSEIILEQAFSDLLREGATETQLSARTFRRLAPSLRAAWLLPEKKYPPDRLPKVIDGKVLQRKEAVIAIISEHFHSGDFLSYLKFYKNIEWAYEAFAAWFNVASPRQRLPVSWEALSTDVRSSIRSILGAKHAHHKINDALALRFATREEVVSHRYFKDFFTYYLIAERYRWGKSFNTIIRKILIHWEAFFSTEQRLKLPVAFLPRRNGEISFQTLLWAKDRKPETILPLFGIAPTLWRGSPKRYQIDPVLHRCFQSNLPLSGTRWEKK